ncbi:TldD/PmbA family protein [Sphaerisporangium sp. NPDC049002]|uniref:TldD/PmbA family protein n=1 Tax=unclassified Sphaerisporangium TaxID=2630420 RepID=UPI0033F7CE85
MLLTCAAVFGAAGLHADDYAEVRVERTRIIDLVWRGDGLESTLTSGDEGCCARVAGPAGSSFASSTTMDASAVLRQATRNARELRVRGEPLADRPPESGEYPCDVGEAPERVSLAEKTDLLGGYHASALAAHSAVTGALVYYRELVTDVELLTTEGTRVGYRRRDLTLQITVYADGGAARTAGSVSVGSGGDFSVARGLAPVIESAAATAVDLRGAPVVEPGSYDVVCDGPLAGVWAHETIGHLAEADHHRGDAELRRALAPGRRLGPSGLTIIDHAGHPGARGYVPVDDEGTPGGQVDLLRDGVVVRPRLHDRSTAAAFGEAPTGNARALSFRHPPLPRLRTIMIDPGTAGDEELIGGVDRGLLARGVLGGQTDRSGFTFLPAECRAIRDGRVGELVRGVVLSGDVLGAFGAIDAIGRDQWRGDTSASCGKQGQYPLPVSSWAPALRLRGLRVHPG